MMIRAESSNGFVEFDRASGVVLNVHEDPGCEGALSVISRVDIPDLQAAYPGGIVPPQVDILECAYWTRGGAYAPSYVWNEDEQAFVERPQAAKAPPAQ